MQNKTAKQCAENAIITLAKCIDASKPDTMEVEDWVTEGETYRVLGASREAIHNQPALAIGDRRTGRHIKPNASIDVIKAGRFVCMEVCQN